MIMPYDPNMFIDREAELVLLFNIASFSSESNILSHEKVVHLIGKSGVGKSWLLHKFFDVLDKNASKSLPIYIDVMDYAGFLGDDFVIWVLSSIDDRVIKDLGINSPFSKEVYRKADYASWIFGCLAQIDKEKAVVLLFDNVDTLSVDQVEELEDYFLENFLYLSNTVLILTGRHLVTGWKNFSLRPGATENVIELLGFDLEKTTEQIKTLKPQAVNLAPNIFELSGGSPGNNKKIINQVVGSPPQIVELDALRVCNQELYDALTAANQELPENLQTELLPALEALCVLQDFDKDYDMPILLATHIGLNGKWDSKRSNTLLNILHKIQIGPGKLIDWDKNKSAYAIEEQIRFILEKELKIRNKDLWKTLHCTAMKMYAEWAREYRGTDIFVKKSDYHKSRLAEAGFDPENCNII